MTKKETENKIKGYTVEVIRRDLRTSKKFHYETEQDARNEMNTIFKGMFCILTEWAQFESGLGNYEKEVARQNW